MGNSVAKGGGKPPRVPPYCHHKPSGQAFVKIAGQFVYLGVYGSDASRAAYAAAVAVADVLTGREVVVAKKRTQAATGCLTVRDLCERFLAHARGYYRKGGKPTAEVAIVAAASNHLIDQVGDLPAEAFGPLALKRVRDQLVNSGLARSTVNAFVARIRRAFRWAASEELIPASVPTALATVSGLLAGRTTAREAAPVLPVADDVVEATIKELPAVLADMVRVQRLTAMRPAEICSLRPCDLVRDLEVWTYRPASHKTEHHGRDRVVFIGPKAQSILLRYLARDSKACCFRPCDSEAKRRVELHATRTTPLSCGDRPGSKRRANPLRTVVRSPARARGPA